MRTKKKTDLDVKKAEYFQIYKSWKKVYCPVLKAYVHFTRWGWNHLVNKKYRKEGERINRLELLPFVKNCVRNSQHYLKARKIKEYDIYEFQAEIEEIRISIIIVKKNKKYYFLSVMRT